MKKFYFIGGLPRTGSTLISCILNQNPRFTSGPYSPVLSTIRSLERNFAENEMYLAYPKPNQVSEIMKSVLYKYHEDATTPVVFDKSRVWTDHVHIIKNYFEIEPKIITTVRDIDYILSSFIRIVKKNSYDVTDLRLNFIDKWLVSCNLQINDENRCNVLMDKNGVVGESIIALIEGLHKNPQNIHIVEYDQLVLNPKKTFSKIYDFLGEEYYEHNFQNITNEYVVDDLFTYGLSGLHDVKKELKYMSPDPKEILPKSILEKYKNKKPWIIDKLNNQW